MSWTSSRARVCRAHRCVSSSSPTRGASFGGLVLDPGAPRTVVLERNQVTQYANSLPAPGLAFPGRRTRPRRSSASTWSTAGRHSRSRRGSREELGDAMPAASIPLPRRRRDERPQMRHSAAMVRCSRIETDVLAWQQAVAVAARRPVHGCTDCSCGSRRASRRWREALCTVPVASAVASSRARVYVSGDVGRELSVIETADLLRQYRLRRQRRASRWRSFGRSSTRSASSSACHIHWRITSPSLPWTVSS